MLLLLSVSVSAQRPVGKMVVGLELASDVIGYTNGYSPLPAPALQIDYPIGKFSVGTALTQHRFRPVFDSYTYLNRREATLIGREKVLAYAYEKTVSQAKYWSVPFRIQYRLPCNCVYLQAATAFDFWKAQAPLTETVLLREQPDNPETQLPMNGGVRKLAHSFELGVGFKLHMNDYWRLVLRPSFVWSQYPDLASDLVWNRTLRMTVGVQYAFLRYGGNF